MLTVAIDVDWAGFGIFVTALAAAVVTVLSKLHALKQTAERTEKLVNHAMEVQLRLNMMMARRLFQETGLAADQEAVEMSEAAYAQHMARQSIVDADARIVAINPKKAVTHDDSVVDVDESKAVTDKEGDVDKTKAVERGGSAPGAT